MNIKYEPSDSFSDKFQSLFKGKFDDISPLWFYNVGTIICMTLIINIATNPLTLLLLLAKIELSKLYDQS